jgi:octanoyl-[GcvH]:protein N-octanoyltransferase
MNDLKAGGWREMNDRQVVTDAALNHMLVLDRTKDLQQRDVLHPFAIDELLCRSAGRGGPAICHLWRHPRGFVLGLADSRLPHAAEAQRQMNEQGWSTAVRNSGGAAVPLDDGVVNISLIMPKEFGRHEPFDHDFELMYRLIAKALGAYGDKVEKGEITGAYCPGNYDLSIGGFKFCGIAQRRQTHAVIVQAFVVAEGSGAERARLVRSFYEQAAAGTTGSAHPHVTELSTASLAELTALGVDGAAAAVFAAAVKRTVLQEQAAASLEEAAARLRMPTEEEIARMVAILRERYTG